MLQWQDTISIQLCTKALDQKLDMGVLCQILLSLHQQLRVTLLRNLRRCRCRRMIQNNLDLHRLTQMLRKTIGQGGNRLVRDQMPLLDGQGQGPAIPLHLPTGMQRQLTQATTDAAGGNQFTPRVSTAQQ